MYLPGAIRRVDRTRLDVECKEYSGGDAPGVVHLAFAINHFKYFLKNSGTMPEV